MSDTTPKIETISSLEDLPGGILPENGVSEDEAMEGLFDALGSDEEFSEEAEAEDEAAPDEGGEDPDEGESDDDEDESDEDESDEEDESDDGENDDEEDEDLYEVTLPGGEKAQVTLEELTAGYSRTEDYTRKRQKDAAEHAEAMAKTRESRDAYAAGLEKIEQALRDLGPQKPDAELRKSNPGEYAAQLAEYQEFENSLKAIGQAKEGVAAEATGEQMEALKAHVEQEWAKVVEAVPEWSDQTAAVSGLAKLKKHAIERFGFTETEIDGLMDSRLLLMLKENHDLTQKRQTTKKKVEERKKTSPRLSAGSSRRGSSKSKAKRKAQRAADKRAAQTGSVHDVARAIELSLDD